QECAPTVPRHARACRGHPRLASRIELKAWMAGTSARLRASFDALCPAMTWRGRSFLRMAIFATCFVIAGTAPAQPPYVPDDWKFGKRQEPNTLHYCVDARDPDFPVARKIGAAIASALLLQPKEHVIGENLVTEDIDNLYRVFLET